MIKKLGLILGCDAGGPDELVFKCLVRRLAPETKVVVRTLGNKRAVFERGMDVAKSLVETDGCDLVLIVWDLKPLFEDAGNCVDETNEMKSNLSGLPNETCIRIKLLCSVTNSRHGCSLTRQRCAITFRSPRIPASGSGSKTRSHSPTRNLRSTRSAKTSGEDVMRISGRQFRSLPAGPRLLSSGESGHLKGLSDY